MGPVKVSPEIPAFPAILPLGYWEEMQEGKYQEGKIGFGGILGMGQLKVPTSSPELGKEGNLSSTDFFGPSSF